VRAIVDVHRLTSDETLRQLASGRDGLRETEAAERLRALGPNALRPAAGRSAARVLLEQLRSTVVLLLVVAMALAAALGEVVESVAIGVVLLVNTALGFFMELRARRAIHALLSLETPRATVIRDGRAREINAHEVVPGDVMQLEAGQIVAADARIIDSAEFRCNESALTGESEVVAK
jgi:P-type Ca2+ transporter type 2C